MIVKNDFKITHLDLKDCKEDVLTKWDIKHTIDNINKLINECELDKRYIVWSGNDNIGIEKNISYYYETMISILASIKKLLLNKIKDEAYLERLITLGLGEEVDK